ncbi:MAG: SDR family NAD(P)-dependent oxidoreductase [Pseudonocardia sp.]|uniref:type I polyketide synthase n=1 Tax=Pseudonocardia sp. TaxID=60912 RepID=UPI001AD355CB|nr:type I polyketide synthase [Pseudonocardia sp.]MBN9101242.1 SDR family NAD(P)-dependent oxidoreductase [Pseudonocardia sp.]
MAAEPIAIVGMAGLFPNASNYRDYWQNIVDAVDCTSDVPATHWRPEDYFDPEPSADPARPDTTYCTRGGFIPATEFSPGEFGMPPNQLEVTTTVQLLSLIVARDVLRDAGATGSEWYDPARTGVVLGVTGPMPLTHPMAARLETPVLKEVVRSCGLSDADAEAIAEKYLLAFPPWEENTFPGLLGNVTAGRIANRLDLGGMNCAVDAACASSLSALRLACSELSEGRADLMITGGCDTENTIFGYMCFSRTHALSKGGRIKPFDDTADGTLVGEGIGMLALKRLADAERDGDRVYAVIRGIGSSSDGRFGSIYAPRASGQELALRRAYVDADCAPESIGLFEGHATGTAVGDRTELTALGTVLDGAPAASAAIGSVKSQIGHTKGAAGTASLMKLALGLHHKVLPPTINVETPNRAIGADSPLYLNTRVRPWIADPRRPRRAAASAMGFGGTNFHVVLQEAGAERGAVLHRGARAHVWHAPDADALMALLRSDAPASDDVVPADHARVGFVSRTDDEAAELRALAVDLIAGESATHPRGIHYRRRALPEVKVGALFAGQGSQYVDMGLRAACDLPPVGAAFDAANAAFPAGDLASVVFPPPLFGETVDHEAALRRTEYAQPAIGALAVGQFRVLRELGLECSGFLGHSFGELVALWAAGALSDEDVVRLARARGAAMAPPADRPDYDAGAMAAVAAGRAEVEEILAAHPGVTVCNDNAPDQVVIGGPTAAVAAAVEALGSRARPLPVAAAFHTEAVGHAVDAFREALSEVEIGRPAGRLVANTDGASYGDDADANRTVLAEQLRRPVEFATGLRRLADDGVTVLVEFGPKQVLTGLARRTHGEDVIAIPTDAGPSGDSTAALLGAAVRLAVLGAPLAGLNRHAAAPFASVAPQGMTVTLTGMTHRPAARNEAYQAALRDGYRVAQPAAPVAVAHAPTPVVPVAPVAAIPVPTVPAQPAVSVQPATDHAADHAADHMDLHTRYLDSQLRITEGLVAVLGRQPAEAPLDASVLAAVESVTASTVAISRGHTRANEVLASLAGFAPAPAAPTGDGGTPAPALLPAPTTGHAAIGVPTQNGGHTDGSVDVGAAAPDHAAVDPDGFDADAFAPAPPGPAGVDAAAVRSALLAVVAEKTGYPVEMVDPAMDLEADLGIDSIKRVQILGAVSERIVGLPQVGPEQLAELRSVDDIVGVLAAGATAAAAPAGVDAAAVRSALLAVVAEKTGYPVEMVDPAMDLEADLGIDSIKRVQILGAVTERIPGLPQVGPEQLAELRSVDDLVGVLAVGAAPVAGPTGPDAGTVRAALLAVVAEKTGYPVEMVDPAMDLEADLGIDSIKRVQILGSVTERVPGLPQVGPEQLAELRSVDDLVGVLAGPAPAAEAPAAPTPATIDPTPRRSEITLVPLPAPDRLDRPFADAPVALVVEIGTGAPAQLTSALQQRGFTLRTLTLPAVPDLGAWDGAATAAAVSAAVTGRLDACVVLLGNQGDTDAALADAVLVAASTTAALSRAAADGRAAFVTVTRLDGALGREAPASTSDAVLGGVTGLVKTLVQEAPGVFARALDVHPELDAAALADVLVTELYDPALTTEVGIVADRGRRTTALVDVEEAGLDPAAPVIGADDVLLVTGGARGVTARCVVALAARSGAEFLLLGRTPLREDPEWAVGVEEPGLQAAALAAAVASTPREVAALVSGVAAQREVRATLDAVLAAGGRARYLAADVTDADAVRTALGADAERVTGLVHGAGTLADAALTDKTPDAVRRVLAPKLAGLRAVLSAVQPKHVVLFGSVAGVLGNPGQADYAAANEALDRVAAALAGPDRHAVCLHWGAWDGGMVTPELKALFASRGVPLLSLDTGAAAFVEQLATSRAGQRSVLVAPGGSLAPAAPTPAPASVARRDLFPLTRDAVIDDHRVGAHPVLPAAAALGWMLRGAEQAHRHLVAVECRDVEVHRGIVLDGTEPAELELHLDVGTVEGSRVLVRAAIRSTDGGGRVQPHFGATVVLAARPGVAPAPEPPTWRLGEGPEDGLGVYADADLFHGPLLQGVRRLIERTPTRLVAECRLPDTPLGGGGWASTLLSPVLGDVVLQAACVLGVWYLDAGCLPLSVGRVELFAPLPADEPFVLVVDDLRPGANGVTVAVAAHAPDGTLLQRWSAVTAVSTPEMAAKFAEAVALRTGAGR